MKHFRSLAVLSFVVIASVMSSCNNAGETKETKSDSSGTVGHDKMAANTNYEKKGELRTGMRQLWEDHVTWTRNVILCVMDGLPGTDQAVARLLKNQDDIIYRPAKLNHRSLKLGMMYIRAQPIFVCDTCGNNEAASILF